MTNEEVENVCKICGKPLRGSDLVYFDWILDGICVCREHVAYVGRCHTCAKIRNCDFETNPSPLPKVIQSTTQTPQGMIISQTVKNPERIKLTCHNCSCWTGEECARDYAPQSKCILDKWEAGF